MTAPEDMDDGANRGKIAPQALWDLMKDEMNEFLADWDSKPEEEKNPLMDELKKLKGGCFAVFAGKYFEDREELEADDIWTGFGENERIILNNLLEKIFAKKIDDKIADGKLTPLE